MTKLSWQATVSICCNIQLKCLKLPVPMYNKEHTKFVNCAITYHKSCLHHPISGQQWSRLEITTPKTAEHSKTMTFMVQVPTTTSFNNLQTPYQVHRPHPTKASKQCCTQAVKINCSSSTFWIVKDYHCSQPAPKTVVNLNARTLYFPHVSHRHIPQFS